MLFSTYICTDVIMYRKYISARLLGKLKHSQAVTFGIYKLLYGKEQNKTAVSGPKTYKTENILFSQLLFNQSIFP